MLGKAIELVRITNLDRKPIVPRADGPALWVIHFNRRTLVPWENNPATRKMSHIATYHAVHFHELS